MKWYKNLNIGTKLLIGFILVALIAGVIGLVGYSGIQEIGIVRLPSVRYLLEAESHFQEIETYQNLLINPVTTHEERVSTYEDLEEAILHMEEAKENYLELPWTKEEEEIWNTYANEYKQWRSSYDNFQSLSETYDDLGLDNPEAVLLNIALRQRDHVQWIWQLQSAILNDTSFQGQLDGNACALGQWLEAYEPRSKDFKTLMGDIEAVHLEVHQSGVEIVNILSSRDEEKISKSLEIYNTVTLVKMNEVLAILEEMEVMARQSYGVLMEMHDQMEENLKPEFKEAIASLEELVTLNVAYSDTQVKQSILLLIIFVGIGLFLSILLGVIISRMIKKPVAIMVTAAKQMADGDLDINIDINTRDEIGILAKAFSTMAEKVSLAMTEINSASEQVAAGANQVSESSMSLSQGATEQASSIEELSASIEEIASQTKLNASHASEANIKTLEAKDHATKGNTQMASMLNSMSDINESSSNISKIIKVIDEIAFQTNILALNAAVEAARAGQHGKGFAVVAEEVRNLAARSAKAAKETTDLIEGSMIKVETGTKIANETAKALEEIVSSIETVTSLIDDISVASKEQSLGVEQINEGINQIANVVQSTSATSQETAAASEELSSQAELLKTQVARFKLKNLGTQYINYEADHKTESIKNQKRIALDDQEFDKY